MNTDSKIILSSLALIMTSGCGGDSSDWEQLEDGNGGVGGDISRNDRAKTEEAIEKGSYESLIGADDRKEVYEHPDASLRALGMNSTLAIMFKAAVADQSNPNNIPINSSRHYERFSDGLLCCSERYKAQFAPGVCSGVLIYNDLILTAAHCLINNEEGLNCANSAYVFNFYQTNSTTTHAISTQDVFYCSKIVAYDLQTDPNGQGERILRG